MYKIYFDETASAELRSLAAPFGLTIIDRQPEAGSFLIADESGISLCRAGEKGRVRVDFDGGAAHYRRTKGGGELIAKAVNHTAQPTVWDATGGLGRDSFVLASLGLNVHTFEQNPAVACLLSDGLNRAGQSEETREIARRITLYFGNAVDLMQELLHLANEKGYSVYFFGAKEEVLTDMLTIFKKDYPNLRVVGHRNGYFSAEEEEAIQEDIREKNPDFVFVGITSPKKEYLIQKFMDNGVNSVFMGVGGSFDVLSGHIKRAPMWMQKANLEWLFRVANEPKRLFKRYFVGNATFIKRVVHEKRKAKK